MVSTILVIVIILLCVAHFYLKSGVLTSFTTLMSAVFAVIISFNFYEWTANQLISRGYGGGWAQPGCFIFLFVFSFAILRTLGDYLVGANINFGVLPTRVIAVVSGIIVGVIVSGTLLITIAMAPLSGKWPYARFGVGQTVKAANINPNGSLFNVDGMVTGLFSWISRGPLSSEKSFAVMSADFVNHLHLNRLTPEKKKEEENPRTSRGRLEDQKVLTIAGAQSVVVPKNGVRIHDDNSTIVRLEIKAKSVEDGGALDENSRMSFTLSQVSLICKPNAQANDNRGVASVVYPENYIVSSAQRTTGQAANLAELITIDRPFNRGNARIDISFKVPDRQTAKFLRFKQNVIVELPKTSSAGEEIEQNLDEG